MKISYLYNIYLILKYCTFIITYNLLSIFIYATSAQHDFHFKLTNAIDPVNFLLINPKNLLEIENSLMIYNKISLCELAGAGKTQLLRKYVQIKKSDYDVIWFFDANFDLNSELIKLAKAINLKEKKILLSEDTRTVVKDIKKYFANKKRWLFVFDNLTIGYNLKLKTMLKWENNGHIIFVSKDANFLPNVINMEKFSKAESLKLAQNFLDTNKQTFAHFISETFYNHPGIVILAAQIVNNFPGLTLKEYKRLINRKIDYVKLNLNLAKKFLTTDAQNLLNKIALINSNFSTDFIKIIHNNPKSYKQIIDLQKLMIIHHAPNDILQDPNSELLHNNVIYEINSLITYNWKKSNSKHLNKKNLNQIIDSIIFHINLLGKKESYIFFTSQTTLDNLRVILHNAEKYKIDFYKIIFLKSCLLEIFMETQDYHSASELKNWFTSQKVEKYFDKDLWKSDFKKFVISEYLMLLGSHSYFSLCDLKNALEYLTKSLQIKQQLHSTPKFILSKFMLLYYFVIVNYKINHLEEADSFYSKLVELFNNHSILQKDAYILHSINAYKFFNQNNYAKTLEEIELSTNHLSQEEEHISENDIINASNLILKARALNGLSRYEESLILLKNLEQIHRNKADDHVTLGIIYLYMAESYLGGKDFKNAKLIVEKGKQVLLTDDKRNINQFLDKSKSKDLDLSYAYQVEGEIFLAEKKYKEAKNCFVLSLKILKNVVEKENALYQFILKKIDHINQMQS